MKPPDGCPNRMMRQRTAMAGHCQCLFQRIGRNAAGESRGIGILPMVSASHRLEASTTFQFSLLR
jgi:hypothetical protein